MRTRGTIRRYGVGDMVRPLRRQYAHRHELWMGRGPSKGCLLGFEKSIDHEGAALDGGSATDSRGGAIHDTGTSINSYTFGIGKNDMASVRNSLWIDRAVAVTQACTIETRAQLTFARPIDRNPREQRFLARKERGNAQEKKSKRCC